MAEIVVTEFMDESALDALRAHYDVTYDPALVDRPEDLAGLVGAARALIVRNRTQVRPALLDKAPRLEVVGRLGVGLDNIDVAACEARGIAGLKIRAKNPGQTSRFEICSPKRLAAPASRRAI